MWTGGLRYRISKLFGRRRAEDGLDEELRFHIEKQTEKYVQLGIDPEAARRRARIEFGQLAHIKEDTRNAWGTSVLESLWTDTRYALRGFQKAPAFTAAIVLTLGLGIGANTAVFSVVSAVLIRPLPYEDPEELTVLWTNFGPDNPQNFISGPEYAEMLEFSDLFEDISVATSTAMTITGSDEPEYVTAAVASGNFFQLLGTQPALGRLFEPTDDTPGSPVAVISDGLWRRRFGGDSGIIGTEIDIDRTPRQVIGVLGPEFEIHYPGGFIPNDVDVWLPVVPVMQLALGANGYHEMPRAFHLLNAFGRLHDGVTLSQARADMDAVAARIRERSPEFYAFDDWEIIVYSLHGDLVEEARPGLILLIGTVAFVLLIACINVASLLLARAASRERETALRTSLGASGWRLLRQLLTEGVVLALVGAGVGLLLAFGLVRGLETWIPPNLPRAESIAVDARVLTFALGISVVAGVLAGLGPVFQRSRMNPFQSLKKGARGVARLGDGRAHSVLVATEVAFAIVLLVGAGLMIRSFGQLLNVSPGYTAQDVLTFSVNLPELEYTFDQQAVFFDRLLERLEVMPGIQAAAAANLLPLGGNRFSGTTWVNETTEFDPDQAFTEANQTYVSPDYFRTMGIRMIGGRSFSDADSSGTRGVAIVDEDFARLFWPDDDPIGKEIGIDPVDADLTWSEVVGVVSHVRLGNLSEPGRPQVYFPYSQSRSLQAFGAGMFVALRTESDPAAGMPGAREAVWELDADQPIDNVATMDARISRSLASERFSILLLSGFAAVALVLAAVGVHGVASYSVNRRNQEIGIRMALGAAAAGVRWMILKQNLWTVGVGIVIGILAALGLSRLVTNLLFGIVPHDPLTYLSAGVLVLAVAALGCGLPAIRATEVSPLVALRHE